MMSNYSYCSFISDASSPHHEYSDVGEEACGDDEQHHRPGKPEAQVPKVKPAHSRANSGSRVETERLLVTETTTQETKQKTHEDLACYSARV